jgi:hypothetical protein
MLIIICFGFMMLIASLVEFSIPKTPMWQKHNAQLANFNVSSLRVITGLSNRRGIAFDASGDLFVAELKALAPGDILKFSMNGSQTVFASAIGQPQGNGGPEFLTFRGGPMP